MDRDGTLNLTRGEIDRAFASSIWAEQFPPVLSVGQVAALLQVPKETVYAWRSRGLLNHCSRRVGKRVRFLRDRLLQQIFNEGLNP